MIQLERLANLNSSEQQVNKVIVHPENSLALTCHENGYVRVFDLNSQKEVRAIQGHSGSISSILALNSSPYFATGGCEGAVKLWDARKYQSVGEVQAHGLKYGEGVCSLAAHSRMPFVATAGADSITKIYTISV